MNHFMKMKKERIKVKGKTRFLALGFLLFIPFTITGAGMPVIDIENIIVAIENGYKAYEQLQATYETIKNAKETLDASLESIKTLSVEELDASDPLGSYRKVMTYANRLMNYEQNIESLLTSQMYSFGDTQYSIKDLFSSDKLKKLALESWDDPFAKKMTREEKARFNTKYGMSYDNYMKYSALGDVATSTAGAMFTYADAYINNIEEDRAVVQKIASDDPGNSVVATAQTGNFLLLDLAQTLKTLVFFNAQQSKATSAQASQDNIDKENRMMAEKLRPKVDTAFKETLYADDEDQYE